MKYLINRNRGFSLVESLVAISILVVVVTGAYSAAQSGIASANSSKNQTIAFYLAQEGMEQVRNMRDENGINGRPWLQGIAENAADPCAFGKVCMADILNSTLSECTGGAGSCPLIKQDPSSGLYGYDSSWTDTNFRREIKLTSVNSNEVTVEVTVSWTRGLLNSQFKATENILSWQ